MNISSVIISVREEGLISSVLESLSAIKDCEIVTHEKDKIVAILSADDVDGEIKLFKEVERVDGVLAVAMVYAYQEDVEFDKDKLEIKRELSEILTNDDIDARDIVYHGHINYKVK